MALFNSNVGYGRILSVIKDRGRVHFAGICGAGMTPLALLLCSLGVTVRGTDTASGGDNLARLRGAGIPVTASHTAAPLSDADMLVYSLAVPSDSPEVVVASEMNIPLVSRAELLGALFSCYGTRIAVAGAHGKSTTVAMLERILTAAGRDPVVISGATLVGSEPCRIGRGDVVLVEACEYRDSFLSLSPTLSVITNVEHEHVDYFPTEQDIYKSFVRFARQSDRVVYNTACPLSCRLARESGVNAHSCGEKDADVLLTGVEKTAHGSRLFVEMRSGSEEFLLAVPGRANVLDALSAIAAADALGIEPTDIRRGLCGFTGISRRLEHIGTLDGRAVYYDYAHHPTEIENTVSALKEQHGELTVIFRPHTYTRTAALFDSFVEVLGRADNVVLLDIYAAREQSIPGVTSEALAAAIGERAVRVDFDCALPYVREKTQGAIVLMGAGEVDTVKKMIEEAL